MVSFDAYHNWLGIPPHEQPPNFYRLLGVVLFESNPEVIQQAADRQSLRVGAYQGGPQGELCQQLLSEIAMAQFCLLDPQQKAAYDGQLQEGLAQRGERAVAPPPPAWSSGAGQFSPPPAQFGPQTPQSAPQAPQFAPQAGMGPTNPGQGVQGPMSMPGLPSPRPAPTSGYPPGAPAPMPVERSGTLSYANALMPAGMPMPSPQPVMQMAPTMMSAPPGFAPAAPRASAPAAMPVAAPFPTARAVVATPAARPATPPNMPPAAPQRAIDELENLASQPPPRRRILKKKQTKDYTREIIIGSVVTGVGILLFIVWAAVASHSTAGFNAIEESVDKKPVQKIGAKLAEERRQKEREIARAKEKEQEEKQKEKKEKEKTAAAHNSAGSGEISPLRPFDERDRPRHTQSSDDGDSPLPTPHNFGPPTRSMDSPDSGGPVRPGPQPNGQDVGPQDLGSDKDPVFDLPPQQDK